MTVYAIFWRDDDTLFCICETVERAKELTRKNDLLYFEAWELT